MAKDCTLHTKQLPTKDVTMKDYRGCLEQVEKTVVPRRRLPVAVEQENIKLQQIAIGNGCFRSAPKLWS